MIEGGGRDLVPVNALTRDCSESLTLVSSPREVDFGSQSECESSDGASPLVATCKSELVGVCGCYGGYSYPGPARRSAERLRSAGSLVEGTPTCRLESDGDLLGTSMDISVATYSVPPRRRAERLRSAGSLVEGTPTCRLESDGDLLGTSMDIFKCQGITASPAAAVCSSGFVVTAG